MGTIRIIVSSNADSAFHFQLLILVMMCENSCSIFFMMLFFLLYNIEGKITDC